MKDNQEQSGLVQVGIWLVGEFGELLTGQEAVNLEGKSTDVSEADVIKLMGLLMEQFTNTTNPEKRNDSIV